MQSVMSLSVGQSAYDAVVFGIPEHKKKLHTYCRFGLAHELTYPFREVDSSRRSRVEPLVCLSPMHNQNADNNPILLFLHNHRAHQISATQRFVHHWSSFLSTIAICCLQFQSVLPSQIHTSSNAFAPSRIDLRRGTKFLFQNFVEL